MAKETILVVDDNRQIAEVMATSILPSLGYDARIAYNGRSALNSIRKDIDKIDLILLDLQMPGFSGLDVLTALKDDEINVPVILFTAHGSEQIVTEALRLGVTDYLTKPIEVDSLSVAISRALTESRLRREKAALTAQLQEQISWLTALSSIGRSVTSTLNLNKVLRRIVEAGVLLTKADQGFLALREADNDQLYLRAVKNIDDERSNTIRLPVRDSTIGAVLSSGRPVRKTRSSRDNPLKVSTGLLVHSLIHVPLMYQENVLGVLSVNNHTNLRGFTEKDEAVLSSLADYAAIAIENANSYEQAQEEIQERKSVERALRESEEQYALVVMGANDGIWDWNIAHNRMYFSPRWKSMLGYQNGEIKHQPEAWFNRVHPDDLERLKLDISAHIRGRSPHFSSEYRILHKNGSYIWVLSRGIAVWDEDGKAIRMVGSQSDITDRKHAEERLIHDAFHDSLTDLPNRALFMDRLNLAIQRSARKPDYQFTVLFMDLDRFKDVNDSLGHVTGDKLLVAVGRTLRKGLRALDTLARFGGDEFVILLDDLECPENAERVIRWIQDQFATPFRIDGHDVLTTVSIGVVHYKKEYKNAEDMIRDADIAMYSAKALGRARAETFEPSMRKRILKRLALEADLRKAINSNELQVYYQPIVSLVEGKLIGFEALARWQHPDHGLLQPIEFIPLAEETDLIVDIDRWVLRKACEQMHIWQTKFDFMTSLTVSVNISGRHIIKPDMVSFFKQVLEETGLRAESLKLELTERSIVDYDYLTAQIFSGLQALGVQIQIDDFGIGYSSLGYLSKFPVNALKISQTFVERIVEDSSQQDIVQAIVMLTERLNVRVIAEGLETKQQFDQLKALGCEFGQGYLIATPQDHEQITEMLTCFGASHQNPWDTLVSRLPPS